jgi:4-hydroxy-4-methyl-2-oxoglutarate aldolase
VSDEIERLRRLDSCVISDALDRHGVGGVTNLLQQLTPSRRIAGRAITVKLGPPLTGGNARSGPVRHLGAAAVDASGTEDIIVVAHQGRTDCAGWGGLLSRGAAMRGVTGVVIDGAARDVAEAAQLGVALYGRAPTPVTVRGRAAEHAWDVPIEIAGITVRPGDLVLADDSGVVVVPAEHSHQVLTTAESIAAVEAAMASAIDAGTPVSEVMGKTYEELTGDIH